jgi:hypothetical protein
MSALRSIFGPALLAMAVVSVLAYFLSGDDDEYLEDAPAPKLAAPEAVPVEPVPIQPPTPVAPPAPPPGEPPPSEPAAEAPPLEGHFPENPFISDAAVPPPLPPKLRDHAAAMIPNALKMALDRSDLKQLKQVRGFLEQRKSENFMPEGDLQAIDHAIACLEEEADARQEAKDFLRFGGSSQFADGVRKVCAQ